MGGASLNDNSCAALLMGQFVQLASQRSIALIIAHHSAKGRDTTFAEAAMGCTTLVNLARHAASLEQLPEGDAEKIGHAIKYSGSGSHRRHSAGQRNGDVLRNRPPNPLVRCPSQG